jgi:D-3-phosphoglycerate dehydrogenase / 2-oxoglutarate reductase
MKILIADALVQSLETKLRNIGCNVLKDASLKEETLQQKLSTFSPDVLVVRSTKIKKEHIQASSQLSLIVRAGAGVNTIDLDSACQYGVFVANCPGKNALAVAELTIGHLINLDRRISDNVQDLRQNQWKKGLYSKAKGLYGRTLAVIGLGSSGMAVVERAQALGMNIHAYSRSLTPQKAKTLGITYCATPLDACRGADALTVHVSYNDQTKGIIGEMELMSLQEGAYVINISRGGIIDEEALLRCIEEKSLRAGLDVFVGEPNSKEAHFEHPLLSHPNIYGTHHIGASTQQASDMVGDAVFEIIETYQKTGQVLNCVNLSTKSTADHLLSVRHADKVGVLAHVLDCLKKNGHNIQEMENIIFSGSKAACARIQIVGRPEDNVIQELRSNQDIFSVAIKQFI